MKQILIIEDDFNDENYDRKLMAIMFTDMKNYSKIMHENELLAINLLSIHNELINSNVKLYEDRVIEIIGDAFLISFLSTITAVNCAVSIQKAFNDRNSEVSETEQICIRVGIHLGEVLEFKNHIKGDVINIASRIQEKANAGSIYISENVFNVIKHKVNLKIEKKGKYKFKNIEEIFQIYKIVV